MYFNNLYINLFKFIKYQHNNNIIEEFNIIKKQVFIFCYRKFLILYFL